MKRLMTHVEFDQPKPEPRGETAPAVSAGIVDWDALPDNLSGPELQDVLRIGRDARRLFVRNHPGLVVRCGNEARIPKERLRRFLNGDSEVVAVAFTNPYASLKPAAPARGAHLRVG